MKFLGIEISKELRNGNISRSPYSDFWYSNSFIQSLSGVTISPSTVLRIAVALSCVRVISETLATLPLKSYTKTGKGREEEDQTDISRLFSEGPNPFITLSDYIETIASELVLRGDHISIIRGKRGYYIETLEPVHPDNVLKLELKRINGQMHLTYWLKNPETKEVEPHPYDTILHIRGLRCNSDPLRGTSVIAHAADAFGAALAADNYAAATFKNQGMPAGVLEYPEGLDEEEVKNIINSWKTIYGGSENAGKVAILEHGLKYTKIGLTPQDTQLLDTRKFSGVLLCGMFRVPPHKVAIMDKATWGNIEHQNIEFATDCIRPWTIKIEQALKARLYPFLGLDARKYYAKFTTEALLRGDIQTRYTSYATGRQWGWLSINDIRGKEDMNPIEKGGDVYLTPMNMLDASKFEDELDPQDPITDITPIVDPVVEETPDPEDDNANEEKSSNNIEELRTSFKGMFKECITRASRAELGILSKSIKKGENLDLILGQYEARAEAELKKILPNTVKTYSRNLSLFLKGEARGNLGLDTLVNFIVEYVQEARSEITSMYLSDKDLTLREIESWAIDEKRLEKISLRLMQKIETDVLNRRD